MVDFNPTISIMIFNVNGLNTSVKRQRIRIDLKKKRKGLKCIQSMRNAL